MPKIKNRLALKTPYRAEDAWRVQAYADGTKWRCRRVPSDMTLYRFVAVRRAVRGMYIEPAVYDD